MFRFMHQADDYLISMAILWFPEPEPDRTRTGTGGPVRSWFHHFWNHEPAVLRTSRNRIEQLVFPVGSNHRFQEYLNYISNG